jgi:hypothetical protein
MRQSGLSCGVSSAPMPDSANTLHVPTGTGINGWQLPVRRDGDGHKPFANWCRRPLGHPRIGHRGAAHPISPRPVFATRRPPPPPGGRESRQDGSSEETDRAAGVLEGDAVYGEGDAQRRAG